MDDGRVREAVTSVTDAKTPTTVRSCRAGEVAAACPQSRLLHIILERRGHGAPGGNRPVQARRLNLTRRTLGGNVLCCTFCCSCRQSDEEMQPEPGGRGDFQECHDSLNPGRVGGFSRGANSSYSMNLFFASVLFFSSLSSSS